MSPAIALYAPYRRLFSGNASARESILLSPPLHPLLGLYSSLSAGHYLLALIAAIGLLPEILPVTLATIPYDPATLTAAYYVSHWISVCILSLMLLALVFIFFYKEPVMPFRPDTVAGNLVYLCDGELPEMFKDFGGLGTRERDRRIAGMGVRYEVGYSSASGVVRMKVLAAEGGGGGW